MIDVESVFMWLVKGAPGAKTPVQVIARLAPELLAAGVPIARVEVFVRTLHPHIAGRTFLWHPGEEVRVIEATWGFLTSPAFVGSPVARVFETGEAVRVRLASWDATDGQPFLADLSAKGYTDFYAGPLAFLSGQNHAISFATREPDGFTSGHLQAIDRVLEPLSRIAEIFALYRTATNLLNTYVGHNAGERILGGQIQRGDTNVIRAVIWFSDLRGFTEMSGRLAPGEVISLLNELFECQVPAIERFGGEVLKFIGDGLLAIFPFAADAGPGPGPGPDADADAKPDTRGRATREAQCDRALEAADAAFATLDKQNAARAAAGKPPIRFGLALHVGEVTYGNIGGAGRLDFTCIGSAVNVAARLESLTGRLSRAIVVSEAFAAATTRPTTSLGVFDLKGVRDPVTVFGPVESRLASSGDS